MNRKNWTCLSIFFVTVFILSSGISTAYAQTNTPPVISISNPDPGQYLAAGSINFSGGAVDAEDGSLHSQMQWSSNVSGFIGSGSIFTTTLPPGDHTITATVTDSGGLTSQATVSGIIVLASNQAPVITINNPSTGDIFGNGEPVTFEGSAIDDHDGDVSETLSWSSNIDGQLSTGPSFTTSELSVGIHTITVMAFDSFFWLSINSVTIMITDEGPPPPPCVIPSTDLMDITSSCVISSDATAPENVIVRSGAVMTIESGVTFDINFSNFNLTVKSGGGVLIKAGGKIA